MFFPDGEEKTLADRRRGEHMMLGFAPQPVTVHWPGMSLEDPLTALRPGSWPAAGPGYRLVSLGSWAGRWLPASR